MARWIERHRIARARRSSTARHQARIKRAAAELSHGGRRRWSATSCTSAASPTASIAHAMFDDLADLFEQARSGRHAGPRASSATTRSSSPRPSSRNYAGRQWIDKERLRLDRGGRPRRARRQPA
ncbi:MAG: hypothetical protein V9F04_13760 [Dermatophilaceae bacterium]